MEIKTAMRSQGVMMMTLGVALTLWGVAFFLAKNRIPLGALPLWMAIGSMVLVAVVMFIGICTLHWVTKVIFAALTALLLFRLLASLNQLWEFEPLIWAVIAGVILAATFTVTEKSDVARLQTEGG